MCIACLLKIRQKEGIQAGKCVTIPALKRKSGRSIFHSIIIIFAINHQNQYLKVVKFRFQHSKSQKHGFFGKTNPQNPFFAKIHFSVQATDHKQKKAANHYIIPISLGPRNTLKKCIRIHQKNHKHKAAKDSHLSEI